ncbi:hypothetical protein ACIPWE_13105 [Streptomyces sp. NPDC090073]|uniref:hypothetical protein n=1 Tax=Streptomyces sp. NPDC090073 TaxID=3365936 RepID=UPI003817399B
MSDQWPVILTAALGVAGTVVVAYIGIHGNRRQTTDQAAVEHEQWLRGQRQEAYVALLDAWDTAVSKLEHTVDVWPEREEWLDGQGGEPYELEKAVEEDLVDARQGLSKPLDRAAILGPASVDAAVSAMDNAFDAASGYLNHQSNPDEPFERDWHSWPTLMTRAHQARRQFTEASKLVLRTPPRPGGVRLRSRADGHLRGYRFRSHGTAVNRAE